MNLGTSISSEGGVWATLALSLEFNLLCAAAWGHHVTSFQMTSLELHINCCARGSPGHGIIRFI